MGLTGLLFGSILLTDVVVVVAVLGTDTTPVSAGPLTVVVGPAGTGAELIFGRDGGSMDC